MHKTLDKMTYIIEVLTPIHVGSGWKLLPGEYVLDTKRRKFVRVNMDGLFRSSGFDFEEYLTLVKRGNFYLGKHFFKQGINNQQYELDCPTSIGELGLSVERPSGYVLEFIKEVGKPYLPGSSIKGSMRSLLIRQLLRQERRQYEEVLDRQLQDLANRRRRITAQFFSSKAEQNLTGRPNNSIFRSLQIGDSQPIPYSTMTISYVKILSLAFGKTYKWKNLGNRSNLDRFEDATPIFFEAVRPGTIVTGRLKIDRFMFQDEVAKLLKLNARGMDFINQLSEICNAEAREIIKGEIEFFDSCGFTAGVSENSKLLNLELKLNEFLLPLSWGTGYRNKAMGEVINSDLFQNIRSTFSVYRQL